MFKVSTAPHINSPQTTQSIMGSVIIALMPALIVGVLFFGLNALLVIITSVAGCVAFEYLISKYMLKSERNTAADCSAVITGLLLAFNLPSNIPLWIVLIGCFVAIGITKMAFGGIGKNLFNPALTGRIFLFISFPAQMTTWPKPDINDFMNADVETGATTLKAMKSGIEELIPSYTDLFMGYHGGCIGEVSVAALLLGFAYLLYKKVITWHIPFYFVAATFLITALTWLLSDNMAYQPIHHILSGGLMLGAIFMATDYTTSPMSREGKIIFAIGCGILTAVIRMYSSYPEGVSFAILIMNALVPIIDKLTIPRVFGRGLK